MSGALHLQPGHVFARHYRLVRALGHGGMGTVYEVLHEPTGALRALKLMLPQFAEDPVFLRRFTQEARMSAVIESDHIVQVLDTGFDEASRSPFIVMELLRGEALSDYVTRARRLPPAALRAIFSQLAHAIGSAHAAGIVHRDLKPENIFLARTRSEGAPFSVKVLDFGIAKVMAESHAAGTVRLGSPLWVAPEQTEIDRPVGPGVDLWALGLLAFYCLTGHSYWLSANERKFSVPAVMRELLFEPLVPASQRAEVLGEPGVIPPGFDEWFARCVHREVEQRFASVAEARQALLALLPDDDVPIDPLLATSGMHAQVPPSPASVSSVTAPRSARPSLPEPVSSPGLALSDDEALAAMRSGRRTALLATAALVTVAAVGGLVWRSQSDVAASAMLPGQPVASGSASSADSGEPARPASSAEPLRRATVVSSARANRPAAAEPDGFLSLVCAPFCESVQIKGRNLGPTPILKAALAPGPYSATLQRKGSPTRTVNFVIQAGQVTSVRVKLDEDPAQSQASCSPPYTVDLQGRKHLKPGCHEM